MSHATDHGSATDYPFATLLRAADRDRILVQVITSVWDTALGLPVLAREGQEPLDGDPRYLPALVGTVRISGAWEGVVAMSCPRWLAAECGALMYDREPASLTEAEVRDAWGELVNMVGGHVKALVPPVSRLALPAVRPTECFEYREPDCKVLNELTFACLGNRLRVTVLKRA